MIFSSCCCFSPHPPPPPVSIQTSRPPKKPLPICGNMEVPVTPQHLTAPLDTYRSLSSSFETKVSTCSENFPNHTLYLPDILSMTGKNYKSFIGGSKGALWTSLPTPAPPSSIQFLKYSCKECQNTMFAHPRPPPLGLGGPVWEILNPPLTDFCC